MQASWSGSILFGMVSVPVQLYKATETHAGPKFHQVHEKDGGRIRLKRFCEAEDEEVPYGEIAKGYETEDEEQLILTSKDLADLPIPSKNKIEVSTFVDADTFDPIQFESAYYVGLAKKSPGKPYILLREALREDGKVALAKVTLSSRESLAMLRVNKKLLVLHTMLWPDEVRPAVGIEPPDEEIHPNELRMARSLIEQMSQDFDVTSLHDEYREALEALVESKLHGGTAASPKPAAASNVIDITELLQRSIDAQKARHDESATKPAAKKTAAKAPARKTAARKTAATKDTGTAKKSPAKRASTRKAG
jgi:DNA end-binding protein Ku